MSKERKIINTNIRLNLTDPADQEAWEHLQHMDRKKYKSYSRAVVASLNDHFRREEAIASDPYLETRQKEDLFLQRVLETIETGAKQSMPMVVMNSLMELLRPAASCIALPSIASDQSKPVDSALISGKGQFVTNAPWQAVSDPLPDADQEESLDDALDFADSF
ncbi:MAG: hypothetical protein IJV14_05200 [Lachnospiraceae bacterium]|nr:hypothetical protein [Lachnospiraceae bacterium]